jgi:hypothetical protein
VESQEKCNKAEIIEKTEDLKIGLIIIRICAKNRETTRPMLFIPGRVLRLENIQYVTNVRNKQIREMTRETTVTIVRGILSLLDPIECVVLIHMRSSLVCED